MLNTQSYKRKAFEVDAVQVTAENMLEAAAWCKGEVIQKEGEPDHIKVKVHRPMNKKQTEATVGDYILLSSTGFKVYPEKAFVATFEPQVVYTEADAEAHMSDEPTQKENLFDTPQELRTVDEPSSSGGTTVQDKTTEEDPREAALRELEEKS